MGVYVCLHAYVDACVCACTCVCMHIHAFIDQEKRVQNMFIDKHGKVGKKIQKEGEADRVVHPMTMKQEDTRGREALREGRLIKLYTLQPWNVSYIEPSKSKFVPGLSRSFRSPHKSACRYIPRKVAAIWMIDSYGVYRSPVHLQFRCLSTVYISQPCRNIFLPFRYLPAVQISASTFNSDLCSQYRSLLTLLWILWWPLGVWFNQLCLEASCLFSSRQLPLIAAVGVGMFQSFLQLATTGSNTEWWGSCQSSLCDFLSGQQD